MNRSGKADESLVFRNARISLSIFDQDDRFHSIKKSSTGKALPSHIDLALRLMSLLIPASTGYDKRWPDSLLPE